MMLLLFTGCLSDADVNGALDDYCARPQTVHCSADTDCCPGTVCRGGSCGPTACLQADAGTLQTDAGCGCDADCHTNQCLAGKCL